MHPLVHGTMYQPTCPSAELNMHPSVHVTMHQPSQHQMNTLTGAYLASGGCQHTCSQTRPVALLAGPAVPGPTAPDALDPGRG